MKKQDPPPRSDLLEGLPRSPESKCPYLPGRTSAIRYLFEEAPSLDDVDLLLESGFRRCGDMWYLNECPGCRSCIPYRVSPDTFVPSRNMKRVLRRNADVTVSIETPELSTDKVGLYLNYQHDQHFLRPAFGVQKKDEFDLDDALGTMFNQMYENPDSSLELTMSVGDRVIGFGTLDVGKVAVSLVYFAFNPDEGKRSLGTLNILKTIEWAKENGYPHVYLGLYIEDHPKMDYKSRFGPAEVMDETGTWVPFVK